ncbi:uncharacterized protein LOC110859024 isoform X2 [Folsomia candida]|uniref:uncharacterized protein LOC110859024 isoform X2 n=1 Tax=Folsomia candida TaxID=158441 RepID=UPI001604B049|nr:uncharacterized protein LOC110859024 isoform X2 [Folsomia candida]
MSYRMTVYDFFDAHRNFSPRTVWRSKIVTVAKFKQLKYTKVVVMLKFETCCLCAYVNRTHRPLNCLINQIRQWSRNWGFLPIIRGRLILSLTNRPRDTLEENRYDHATTEISRLETFEAEFEGV